MVDADGEVVDGDDILYIIAKSRLKNGGVKGSVVGTLMSNLGLEQALGRLGIGFERAQVGDRYVMEQLQANGWSLGGESSGHIICLDRSTTGDGIIAALQVIAEVFSSGKSLRELLDEMSKYPQTLLNVPLEADVDVLSSPVMQHAVSAAETELAQHGRVLLRPSGTEPLIRVMVEGGDQEQVTTISKRLAAVVRELVVAEG
jgi:phosphoglucosamine mutase